MGKRVVVIGGSIAGLLAAKILSPYYNEVVIFDKDELGIYPKNRKMAPQSNHVHIVLKAGEEALNRVFPDFTKEMLHSGAVSVDMTQEMISCNALGLSPKWESGISLLSQSRALLEQIIFQRVKKECNNLILKQNTLINGYLYDREFNRIKGVKFKHQGSDTPDSIPSDLVVDASGRGALSLRWFKKLGIPLPSIDEVKVAVGYASCCVRLKNDPNRTWKGVECGGPIPNHKIAGMLMPIENGLHICSVTSRFNDFPPTDETAFFNYLSKFPHNFFSEALNGAEIVSPIQRIRYEHSKFHRYDKHQEHPKGFIPIGDALCSVNPCYGQGMSSSVLQSEILLNSVKRSLKHENIDGLAKIFFDEATPLCQRIWKNACLKDLRYTQTESSDNFVSDLEMKHYQNLEKESISNKEIRLQIFRQNHLLDKAYSLFSK